MSGNAATAANRRPRIFVVANFVMACCWQVARLPRPGETLHASALSMEPGGKGLNVAIGTRRLGADVTALLGIGADAAGDRLQELLKTEDISTAHVHTIGAQSGYGAGMIGGDGQNAIAVFAGPNLLLDARHVDQAAAAIAAADLVYGQFETSLAAVQSAFVLARSHGVRTVLNPSPWMPIPMALLAHTGVIIVNEAEAAELLECGELPEGLEAWQVAARLGPALAALWAAWSMVSEPWLVVTLGSHGCVAFSPGHATLAVPGHAIDALDTMGAGDAFASALCLALCANQSMALALDRANAAGALVASRRGVLGALPHSAQLDAFQASRRNL